MSSAERQPGVYIHPQHSDAWGEAAPILVAPLSAVDVGEIRINVEDVQEQLGFTELGNPWTLRAEVVPARPEMVHNIVLVGRDSETSKDQLPQLVLEDDHWNVRGFWCGITLRQHQHGVLTVTFDSADVGGVTVTRGTCAILLEGSTTIDSLHLSPGVERTNVHLRPGSKTVLKNLAVNGGGTIYVHPAIESSQIERMRCEEGRVSIGCGGMRVAEEDQLSKVRIEQLILHRCHWSYAPEAGLDLSNTSVRMDALSGIFEKRSGSGRPCYRPRTFVTHVVAHYGDGMAMDRQNFHIAALLPGGTEAVGAISSSSDRFGPEIWVAHALTPHRDLLKIQRDELDASLRRVRRFSEILDTTKPSIHYSEVLGASSSKKLKEAWFDAMYSIELYLSLCDALDQTHTAFLRDEVNTRFAYPEITAVRLASGLLARNPADLTVPELFSVLQQYLDWLSRTIALLEENYEVTTGDEHIELTTAWGALCTAFRNEVSVAEGGRG